MSVINPVNDVLQVRIEDDGTITVVSGRMGAEVHQAADQFLADVTRLSGGERQDTRLAQQHYHVFDHHHHHNHEHGREKARG